MRRLLPFILPVFLLVAIELSGKDSNSSRTVDLSPFCMVLEDTEGSLDADRVLSDKSLPFLPLEGIRKNRGFSSSCYWIRISMKDVQLPPGEVLLVYNQSWTREVDLYTPSGQVISTGTGKVFSTRPFRDRVFAFPLDQKNPSGDYLLHLRSDHRLVLDFSLWSVDDFRARQIWDGKVYTAIYAILFTFVIYNLILLVMIRERIYIYFVAYMAAFISFLLSFDGTGYMFMWGNYPAWEDFNRVAGIVLQNICLILFFVGITSLNKVMPRMVRYFISLIVIELGIVILGIFLTHRGMYPYILFLLQISAFSIFFVSIYLAWKGSRQALYFVLTFIFLLGAVIVNTLMSYGLMDVFHGSMQAMHVSAVISCVIFSMALADRVNTLRRSTAMAEKEARDNNNRLQKVNEELVATNEEMEASNEELLATMEVLEATNNRLWESEQQLSAMFNNATIAIALMDTTGRIIKINRHGCDLVGYGEDELKGHLFSDITYEDDRAGSDRNLGEIISGKVNFYRLEKRYRHRDGHLLWVDVSVTSLFDELGTLTGFIGVALDIDQRKAAEEEKERIEKHLRQAQKMEAVGTLAGGIAHDFNNILTAVLGYTELTLSRSDIDESTRENLDNVLQAAARARDLVKQLLTISRQGEDVLKPIHARDVVGESLRLMRATIPTTIDIKIEDRADRDVIYGDSVQIQQVILNLCTNASHAIGPAPGVITVRIENRSCDIDETPRDCLVLEVGDTGHGMTPEIMERIFDPFFTTKPQGMGTGLGLAVVDGIVGKYGGIMSVTSEVGKGTTFTICIPLYEGDMENVAEDRGELPGGMESILVVDDEPIIADINGHILRKLGYHVISSCDSREALKLFMASPDRFNLVITDQTMPGLTGVDLAREIRARRPDLPIILCTGFSEAVDAGRARAEGINLFLLKPVSMKELAVAVRKVLNRQGRSM